MHHFQILEKKFTIFLHGRDVKKKKADADWLSNYLPRVRPALSVWKGRCMVQWIRSCHVVISHHTAISIGKGW